MSPSWAHPFPQAGRSVRDTLLPPPHSLTTLCFPEHPRFPPGTPPTGRMRPRSPAVRARGARARGLSLGLAVFRVFTEYLHHSLLFPQLQQELLA